MTRISSRMVLHMLRFVFLCTYLLYFLGFMVSLLGLSLRLGFLASFITALSHYTFEFLPTLHVIVTQGNCHMTFLAIFLACLFIEWRISCRLYALQEDGGADAESDGVRATSRAPRR